MNLTFCGGLSAGGGFYTERKKLAMRAAGAGKWTGYEGVAGSSIGGGIGGANVMSGAGHGGAIYLYLCYEYMLRGMNMSECVFLN